MKLDNLIGCIESGDLAIVAEAKDATERKKLNATERKKVINAFMKSSVNKLTYNDTDYNKYIPYPHSRYKEFATSTPSDLGYSPIDASKIAKIIASWGGNVGKTGKQYSHMSLYGGFINKALSRKAFATITGGMVAGDVSNAIEAAINLFLREELGRVINDTKEITMPINWDILVQKLDFALVHPVTTEHIWKHTKDLEETIPLPSSNMIKVDDYGNIDTEFLPLSTFLAYTIGTAVKSELGMSTRKVKSLDAFPLDSDVAFDVHAFTRQMDYLATIHEFMGAIYTPVSHNGILKDVGASDKYKGVIEGFEIADFVEHELSKAPDTISREEIATIDEVLRDNNISSKGITSVLDSKRAESDNYLMASELSESSTIMRNIFLEKLGTKTIKRCKLHQLFSEEINPHNNMSREFRIKLTEGKSTGAGRGRRIPIGGKLKDGFNTTLKSVSFDYLNMSSAMGTFGEAKFKTDNFYALDLRIPTNTLVRDWGNGFDLYSTVFDKVYTDNDLARNMVARIHVDASGDEDIMSEVNGVLGEDWGTTGDLDTVLGQSKLKEIHDGLNVVSLVTVDNQEVLAIKHTEGGNKSEFVKLVVDGLTTANRGNKPIGVTIEEVMTGKFSRKLMTPETGTFINKVKDEASEKEFDFRAWNQDTLERLHSFIMTTFKHDPSLKVKCEGSGAKRHSIFLYTSQDDFHQLEQGGQGPSKLVGKAWDAISSENQSQL